VASPLTGKKNKALAFSKVAILYNTTKQQQTDFFAPELQTFFYLYTFLFNQTAGCMQQLAMTFPFHSRIYQPLYGLSESQ